MNQPVIDLTEDDHEAANADLADRQAEASPPHRQQRLPNFGREIIDLSADTSPVGAEEGRGGARIHQSNMRLPDGHMAARRQGASDFRRESSSEVVFVSERPRSNSPTSATGSARRGQPIFADLTEDDDDDDVVHVRTASRTGRPGGANLPPPIGRGNIRAIGIGLEGWGLADVLRREQHHHAPRLIQRLFGGAGDEDDIFGDDFDVAEGPVHRRPRGMRTVLPHTWLAPGIMNYDLPGFGLGGDARTREPTPEYHAPPALPQGFTGDPTEDEAVVCPACGDELALGESEEKRQVWIVKNCGHVSLTKGAVHRLFITDTIQVYCGTCMKNRGKRAKGSSKGKGRADAHTPIHFSQCVVDDCDSKVSHKTMVQQIFL